MFELILDLALAWVAGLMLVVAIALVRVATLVKRLVLMDLSVMMLVCLLVILSVRRDETYFLDAALALSLLSFVGTVAVTSYASRRQEPE
jgi:multicomponent Na+:H+ antiporter subunit F